MGHRRKKFKKEESEGRCGVRGFPVSTFLVPGVAPLGLALKSVRSSLSFSSSSFPLVKMLWWDIVSIIYRH